MKKEWYTAMELTGVGELPRSPQGVNARAKREEWMRQKRAGVQGRAIEYHYSCFPETTLAALELNEISPEYQVQKQDPLSIWVSAFNLLTDEEKEVITEVILRDGIRSFLEKILAT
ncbi:putative DNA-binding transcriptional regulator [Xenorhabdus sp. PB61.4]|uniref:Cytoplasmic protein n=1 Tax=Xenorhabdus stockiae TaxID=351614 RepID=A0A2D0KTT6_9GAMM|nr:MULTISPECIES: DNA-binding protein [Xenorhabdus]MCC8365177.1 putative DNA-binding transcriptional regulator [Xenorhabdus sp. PB61.4]PHM66854.1 cytoplasmic protein [Xenorhabdus stockiae]PHM71068.1 cytoplasmic protein [Xenorhabdus sp. KJ12.1]